MHSGAPLRPSDPFLLILNDKYAYGGWALPCRRPDRSHGRI